MGTSCREVGEGVGGEIGDRIIALIRFVYFMDRKLFVSRDIKFSAVCWSETKVRRLADLLNS